MLQNECNKIQSFKKKINLGLSSGDLRFTKCLRMVSFQGFSSPLLLRKDWGTGKREVERQRAKKGVKKISSKKCIYKKKKPQKTKSKKECECVCVNRWLA